MNIHQGLQSALGVSNSRIEEIVYALREAPGIDGAKISGSGLGDCVVGVGQVGEGFSCQAQRIEVAITTQGVCCG